MGLVQQREHRAFVNKGVLWKGHYLSVRWQSDNTVNRTFALHGAIPGSIPGTYMVLQAHQK